MTRFGSDAFFPSAFSSSLLVAISLPPCTSWPPVVTESTGIPGRLASKGGSCSQGGGMTWDFPCSKEKLHLVSCWLRPQNFLVKMLGIFLFEQFL